MDISHLLSATVTPGLISACGLVTLALYNRYGAILSRLRGFHQQKLDVLKGLNGCDRVESQSLLKMIDLQIEKVTRKARLIQRGLYFLLSAVVAFLFCSLFVAMAVMHELFSLIALGMHLIGLLLFFAGISWAIRELTLSITPLDEENDFLETIIADHLAKLPGSETKKYRIAESA